MWPATWVAVSDAGAGSEVDEAGRPVSASGAWMARHGLSGPTTGVLLAPSFLAHG